MGHSIKCYACGAGVWDYENDCPQCGADQTIPFEEKEQIVNSKQLKAGE